MIGYDGGVLGPEEIVLDQDGNVVSVSLYSRELADTDLVHLNGLTNLEDLSLGYSKISDAGFVYLKGLTKLRRLRIGCTQVTDAGSAELQKALTDCKIHN